MAQQLNFESARPLWVQLADVVREQIRDGALAPDTKLPSQTELVAQYAVSRGTAARAITLLRDEHWAVFSPGRGLFTNTADQIERLKKEEHRPPE